MPALAEEVHAQLLLQQPVLGLEAPGEVVGDLEERDHADRVHALQAPLEPHAQARGEEGVQVHAHHVVRQPLRHDEDPPVELAGVDGVDAVGVRDEAADLAVEELLPGGTARVAVPVQPRRHAAHSLQRLLEHRHVAADAPEAFAQQAEGALLVLMLVEPEDLADLPERGGVDAVRQRARVAVDAAVRAVAGGDGAQKALRRAVAAGLRVGAGGEEAAVVVGAAGERLAPGRLAVRLDALALGHLLDLLLRELRGDRAQEPVGPGRARAVAALQHVEQEQHALHRVGREAAGDVEERVREEVGDLRLAQARDQVEDVLTGLVGDRERLLVDAQGHHVHALLVVGEPGVELAAQERARQVGDRQRPAQRVVVGDGDEVHAPGALGVVQLQRFGERLGTAQRADARVARRVGVPGVDVEVGSVAVVSHLHSTAPARSQDASAWDFAFGA